MILQAKQAGETIRFSVCSMLNMLRKQVWSYKSIVKITQQSKKLVHGVVSSPVVTVADLDRHTYLMLQQAL